MNMRAWGFAALAAVAMVATVAVDHVRAQVGPGPTDILGQTVIGIQGWPVAPVSPLNGQVLKWDSTIGKYRPQ